MENSLAEENEFSKWHTRKFIAVFLMVVAAFLFTPFLTNDFYSYLILQYGFLLLLLSIVYSINRRSRFLFLELSCIIPFIIFDLLGLYRHSLFFMAIGYGFASIFMVSVIYIFTKKILYSSLITTNLLFGALIIYLLAGILWGKIYFITNVFFPGSFHSNGKLDFYATSFLEAFDWQFNLVYYSFSVMTSLGLGDIVPLQGLAKSFTILEAMFGQLFVAIIIAKLVSTWRQTLKI